MARSGEELVEAWFAEHPVDCHGQSPGTELRSQATAQRAADGHVHVRYLRRYIEDGYEKSGMAIPAATSAAFDFVDGFGAARENQIAIGLTRGQLLAWTNPRFLHGRRDFREAGSRDGCGAPTAP